MEDDDVYRCYKMFDPLKNAFRPLPASANKLRALHLEDADSDYQASPESDPGEEVESERDECDDGRPGRRFAASSRKRITIKLKRRHGAGATGQDPAPTHAQPLRKKRLSLPILSVARPVLDGDMGQAQQRLHVAAVPQSLPCREMEFLTICEFVRDCVRRGTGGCIFVSGVPGTGKTATIRTVAKTLQQERDAGELNPFKFIEVNGMALATPHHVYAQLWDAIHDQEGGKRTTTQQAVDLLTKHFTKPSPRRSCTVVLLDELDQLWTRKQDVLYNLFDWPNHRNSRLVVVAVANTMDLPERVLAHRVSSRLGLTRLSFLPYTYLQLEKIINLRLDGVAETFQAEAVEFCARKVAAISGDARRVLDICRRAAELAQREGKSVRILFSCCTLVILNGLLLGFICGDGV